MKTKCCNIEIPPEVEPDDVIMPCGKCYVCCEHLHINQYVFPRGTDLKEALTQIQNGEAETIPPKAECWLCGGVISGEPTIINVERETPNGKPCKPKDVPVHYGCYMDVSP